MTKSRIFLWGMLAFVAGVGVRSFVYISPVVIWIAASGAGLGIGISSARKNKTAVVEACLALVCILGVVRFDSAQSRRPDILYSYGVSHAMRGIVTGELVVSGNAQRLKIKITSVDDRAAGEPFFVLATVRKYPAYALGDELNIAGAVERPENFSDFDYVSYLARDDIFAVMSYPKIEKIGEGRGNRILFLLSRAKHAFEENIDTSLPQPHAGFMQGLLLGTRSSLPQNILNDFQIAGVSHIVALSGYNITIVGRFITTVLLFLTIPFAVSFWIATAGIILFVLLTGAAASVVRAGIMGVLVLLAQKEGRPYYMTNALVFAGTAMVLHNPFILRFDAGFQLSFLATIGLVYLSPRLDAWIGKHRQSARIPSRIRSTFVETMSAQLMVLPLLISLFGRVSLVSPVTNILVLVAVPYAMAAGFAAGIAGFLWRPAGILLGFIAWTLLEYQLRIISFFAHVPFASVGVGSWIVLPLVAFYAAIIWSMWRKSNNMHK